MRGAVDETTFYFGRRSSRSAAILNRVSRRVFFTDSQGPEVISISDELQPEQRKAVLDHVLRRTGLQPVKRERQRLLFDYTN